MCSKYTNIALYYDLATVKALAPVRRRIAHLLQSGQSAGQFEQADLTGQDRQTWQAGQTVAPGQTGQTGKTGQAGQTGQSGQPEETSRPEQAYQAKQAGQTGPDESPTAKNQPSSQGACTEPRKPCRVLDIGCGTGVQLEYLDMAGFECAGVDESPEMLERAKERCKNANLVQAPADKLPFADNSFDTAILSLILHESDTDPQKILAEAARVASRVLVLEWKMPERNMDYLYWLPMHIIERMAGKQHFRRFREYMRNGALEGMVYRFNLEAKKSSTAQLESTGYEFFRLGSLVLMDLRKIVA
ncbi:methyltransferase domain-containing protein [Desulfovibrio sp. OttesenSCG-928-C06]|nr:methyltransferase domain-containing protein [Desulfovibrio sp. OttesenSCG-928-C06]